MNNVVWTNNQVALTKDFIFGVSVFAGRGWMPLDQLDLDDIKMVFNLVDFNKSCPFLDDISALIKARMGQ